MKRLPIVGVMGSGVREHEILAVPLGRRLARMRVHLLTGGGGGVMQSAARAFVEVKERAGLAIGVVPMARGGGPSPGLLSAASGKGDSAAYPNPWIEVVIRTHLGRDGDRPTSRNHINVLTSDVVVALPGGAGTASEVELALRYGCPVVVLGGGEGAAGQGGNAESGASALARAGVESPGLARADGVVRADRVVRADSVGDAVEFVRRSLAGWSGGGPRRGADDRLGGGRAQSPARVQEGGVGVDAVRDSAAAPGRFSHVATRSAGS